jgi:hypothetical protein
MRVTDGRVGPRGERRRRRVPHERRRDAEHDDDQRDLRAHRASQQASRAAGSLTRRGEPAQAGDDAPAVDRAERDEDDRQAGLDEHGAPERRRRQRIEMAHVHVGLDDPADEQHADRPQGDRGEAHEHREQARALGRLEVARRRGHEREQRDEPAEPRAHGRDVRDVERDQQPGRRLRARVAGQCRRDRDEHGGKGQRQQPRAAARKPGGAQRGRPQRGQATSNQHDRERDHTASRKASVPSTSDVAR